MALLSTDKHSKKVQAATAAAQNASEQLFDEKINKKKRAESYWAVSWNIFKKNKLGMLGGCCIAGGNCAVCTTVGAAQSP